MHTPQSLFANLPSSLPKELVNPLLEMPGFRIERIVSYGHSSPEGFWYDQDTDEWVVIISGAARLQFHGEEPIEMKAGSFINIAAHQKHRIVWTDPNQPTIWLAVHSTPVIEELID